MTGVSEAYGSGALAGDVSAGRHLSVWMSALIGVGGAVVGLLPWLLQGLRLPLQNLWAVEVAPGEMPLVLLPFSQYALTTEIVLMVVGAAVAGLLARLLRSRMPRRGVLAMFLALIVVQLGAIVQTYIVVQGGLQDRSAATFYLAAVTGVAVLAMLVGIAVFWLIARAPRAGTLIGFAMAAVALAPWLSELAHPLLNPQYGAVEDFRRWAANMLRWVPAILLGCAVGWCGIRSVGRVIAVLVSFGLLWVVPALATAISYAAGSRVYASDLQEMASAGFSVFRQAATLPEIVVPPLALAVVVAVLVGVLLRLLRRRRGRSAATLS
jgi:MFS family permease